MTSVAVRIMCDDPMRPTSTRYTGPTDGKEETNERSKIIILHEKAGRGRGGGHDDWAIFAVPSYSFFFFFSPRVS